VTIVAIAILAFIAGAVAGAMFAVKVIVAHHIKRLRAEGVAEDKIWAALTIR